MPTADVTTALHAAARHPRTCGRLLTPAEEAQWLWRLRRWLLLAAVGQAIRSSRLRLIVIALLSLVFWIGLYALFAEGFQLLTAAIAHEATLAKTVEAIYNVFFLALLAMLTVSAGIIFYGAVFRSDDVPLLLTTPLSARRIVILKLEETVLFTCWGFLLMGTPMLIAYGVTVGSPWYYFAMILPLTVSFVFIPASIGSLACLLIVFAIPRARVHAATAAAVALIAAAAAMGWIVLRAGQFDVMTPMWLDDVLTRLQYSEQRLLPSWWLSSGLLEAAHGRGGDLDSPAWRESVLFLAVLVSNAMLGVVLLVEVGQKTLRSGYSRLQGLMPPQRYTRPVWIDRVADLLLRPLPAAARLLMLKDLRLFRRDPVQWSQFVIFFGLLTLYFLNIRRFQYGEHLQRWMNMIGFLNLGVVGLILSTFTTRFIFPMISLEGRRFWLLGSLPVRRDTILWSKLLFACAGSIPPCCALIFLSDLMLGIARSAPEIAAIRQLTCLVLCVGLSSIAVGLGARLPSLRETSPSKVAAGFGGTLNLVLSAAFIVAVVLVTATPCYFLLEARQGTSLATAGHWLGLGSFSAVLAGVAAMLAIGLAATVVPLWIGIRAFRRLEF